MKHRTIVTNVLVIGSGGAGLRAAIAAHEEGVEVLVVGKRIRKDAHTVLAAGGINAALGTVDPEDSPGIHFADTFSEGYGVGDPRAIELLVGEAPQAVNELADWGCAFARTDSGDLDQRFFGAHRYRRTCYAGDYTGRAVVNTLVERTEKLAIPIMEHQYISCLLVEHGVCFGALGFDLQSGERTVFLADAVVLAAGGHTRIWRKSSSRRDENTGDGMYLAMRAGCTVGDMEMVQFHPTGMVYPEAMEGTLVTEAVRGEGGHLLNSEGERFMERYDAERMELSTRDRVALANYTEIIEGRGGPHGGVFLDISHREKNYILEKLPRMYRQFMESQMLDISREPMEVAPTAHYSMGGVVVDAESHATEVFGLFAAGEVTCGVHGANRLGGNSLAEIVVFGRRAGEAAAALSSDLRAQIRSQEIIKLAHEDLDSMIREGGELARPLQRAVRDTMWKCGGVVRSEDSISKGISRIAEIRESAESVDVRPGSEGFGDLALALDLRGSLWTAEATLQGALARRESRGAHQRSDFPMTEETVRVNYQARTNPAGVVTVMRRDGQKVPPRLAALLEEQPEIELAGRLLE